MKLHVGTSGFSYDAWKGSFYPEKISSNDMLPFYASKFAAVELNGTFYRIPSTSVLEGMASKVPPEFRFAAKCSQRITHRERLKDSGETLAFMLGQFAALGAALGPVLYQLPPNLKCDLARLNAFLDLFPPGHRAAFEFRNVTWFTDEVYEALRARDVSLCVAEDEKLATPFVATASWGYLRLRKPEYDDAALRGFRETVGKQAWSDAFVFFKHEDEARGPAFAKSFLELPG